MISVDLQSYFDTIPHDRLMNVIESSVVDQNILKMIKAWLKAKVVDNGVTFNPEEGSPQGGIVSPLLSNWYLHQFDKQWHQRNNHRKWRYDAIVTRYADDILIQSPKKDPRIWEEAKEILVGLGLVINEDKTQFLNDREGFDYLGYHFVRDYSKRHGKDVTHVVPTHESKKRVWGKIRWYTDKHRYQNVPIAWVVKHINPVLIGWTNYYRHTHSHRVFKQLQTYTNDRIRKALRYRSKKGGVQTGS